MYTYIVTNYSQDGSPSASEEDSETWIVLIVILVVQMGSILWVVADISRRPAQLPFFFFGGGGGLVPGCSEAYL